MWTRLQSLLHVSSVLLMVCTRVLEMRHAPEACTRPWISLGTRLAWLFASCSLGRASQNCRCRRQSQVDGVLKVTAFAESCATVSSPISAEARSVSDKGPPSNQRLKLAARVHYGMNLSSARRSLSALR